MTETLATTALSNAQDNPLLRPWQTPFETPPFDEIRPEHFLPAFEQAFADQGTNRRQSFALYLSLGCCPVLLVHK